MARNFDRASNHRIEIAGLPDFTSQFSLSAWIRTDDDPGALEFYTVFSKAKTADGNDRNIGIDIRSGFGTTMEAYWSQPTGTFIQYRCNISPAGAWTQIVWTIDWTTNPDQVLAYINGTSASVNRVGSDNATPTTGAPQIARIGGLLDSPSSAFEGDIAELAIWPLVLTAGEARALSQGYSPFIVHPANLAFYAPLVRELFDYTGKTTLTNQGSTVTEHPRVIYPGKASAAIGGGDGGQHINICVIT